MPVMPTGTVTFLFTDIEGSTKRWEQYPQQMESALQRHDAILRSAIEQHGGYIFKTVGDAFCAAFSTAIDALSATLAAHHALQAEEWGEIGPIRIRVALHTGMVQEREGDYFGPTLNRVARLQSAGHGGQTLLSLATYELVRDHLPAGVELRDMGEHRLKDLTRPEHVYQLVTAGLSTEFPLLKTLDNRPNNLPMQHTELIGREKEVAEIVDRLHQSKVRLLTLTGPGGTGKTRLALQAGAEMLDDYPDGMWFVNLAPLTDHNLVISTVAQTLSVKEAGGTSILESVKSYLGDKRLLLVLDNFEHVVEAAPSVNELIEAAPNLKVLATTRAPLRVQGEYEYAVPPLQLPDPRQLPPLEKLTQYEAVRLFIERAQAVKADFEVTNSNAPAVAEICVRLDGLPLAIELAAARVKMLPPHALLTRLSSRLKMLAGGARDVTSRQQTLRGAIGWSYDLLDEGHKQLFRRMAVFQGGRTLEALEAVCNYDSQLQVEVFDGVETLLSGSLLQQREGTDGEPRFWMLETIHEYAREKLEESGEAEKIMMHHALYFRDLAEEADPKLRSSEQIKWVRILESEHDNFRAAIQWTVGTENADIGLRLATSLGWFWFARAYYREGREQFTRVLSFGRKADDKAVLASALSAAGKLDERLGGTITARSHLEEALAIFRTLGDKDSTARALNNLANVMYGLLDYEAARSMHQEALAIRQEIGDRWGIAQSLHNLGEVAWGAEEYEEAYSLITEALLLFEKEGDRRSMGWLPHSLGHLAHRMGAYKQASECFTQSLTISYEVGERYLTACALTGLAGLAATLNLPIRSAKLFGAGDAIFETIGAQLAPADLRAYQGNLASSKSQIDEGIWRAAWAEGSAMSMEQAITYALEDTESE